VGCAVWPELMQVGSRLRAARRARGWSLEALAARAGMSASTLSRLESGKRQASLELLVPLTRHLGIRIDDLLAAEPPDPRVRRESMRRDRMIIEPLAPEDSPTQTYKITFLPTTTPPALRVHDGWEWLYVLSGRLRLRLGEQDLILGRGEAAEFHTHVPHSLSAAGSRPVQILSIFNETGARIHLHGTTDDGERRADRVRPGSSRPV
jgi:transcriptional regulator with XRE-family HTH domain